ncbi:Os03g0305150 [Oryza sativa Japonica Group]|uniref:Os03g0305150 protein n=1 Tax=Oryza sativa subsp. japonica TaxID=39947 RepID=A0A0P0VWH3_ORYSJ|nr:hypothetical protein EE612_016936 [Oryza sativa]BAS83800.1 Os03g0305150 [Oryza sativa Japonica Group]
MVHYARSRATSYLAKTYVGSTHRSHCPSVTPTITMEHGQSPQVHSSLRHPPNHGDTERHDIGATVVQHDALGARSSPGGVTQRDALPFILGRLPGELRVTGLQELLVLDRSSPQSVLQRLRIAGRVADDDQDRGPERPFLLLGQYLQGLFS